MLFRLFRLLITVFGRPAFLIGYTYAAIKTLDDTDARGQCGGGFYNDPWWFCVVFGAAYLLVVLFSNVVRHWGQEPWESIKDAAAAHGDVYDLLLGILVVLGLLVNSTAGRACMSELKDDHRGVVLLFRCTIYAPLADLVLQGLTYLVDGCLRAMCCRGGDVNPQQAHVYAV